MARFIYFFGNQIPQIAGGIQFVEFLRCGKQKFTGPIEPRPYGLYWNRPNYHRKGFQQTDSNGFRYKGYDVRRVKNKKRILAYGGSTTFSDHVLKNPNECWTYLLEGYFLESGLDIEIVNCGLNYGLTSELVSHLLFEGTHFNPDYVILHGPGNDSLPIAIGDTTNDYRSTRKSNDLNPRFFEPTLLRLSALARIIYAFAFREYQFAVLEPSSWDPQEVQNARLKTSDLPSFHNNVRNFVNICLGRNIKVILIDFVQTSPEMLESLKPGLSEGMVEIVAKMNRFFAELSQEFKGSVFHVPMPTTSFEPTDFVDVCHPNKAGEERKASLIFSAISEFVDN